MSTTATVPVDELTRLLMGLDAEPWKLRPADGGAILMLGKNAARVRGALDSAGYDVRVSDVPVRDGWDTALEVSP